MQAIEATSATLAIIFLTTNWFLPWYVISLVTLAVLWMWKISSRAGYALVAFIFTFSFSACVTYYYNFIGAYDIQNRPGNVIWLILAYLVAFLLSVTVFCLSYLIKARKMFTSVVPVSSR